MGDCAVLQSDSDHVLLASSTPLRIASGTSAALPRPAPTLPLPSPTTTTAAKEKRRPPLTTLATRLMKTTFSCKSDSCFQILACVFSFYLKISIRLHERLQPKPGLFRDRYNRRGRTRLFQFLFKSSLADENAYSLSCINVAAVWEFSLDFLI